MGFFAKYKLIILLAVAIVVAFIGWRFISPEPTPATLLTTEAVGNGADAGIVDTLLTLRAVTLTGSIFQDPAFLALRDFGIQIMPEPVGRENPFAPLSFKATSTARATQLFGTQQR